MTTNAGFIYLGDGVTTTYPITFAFDDPLDVSITLDGVLLTLGQTPNGGNGFTISGSNFTFTRAPDVGADIFGLRTTDLECLFEFANKSTLEKDALDGMYKQLLYAIQEGVANGARLVYMLENLTKEDVGLDQVDNTSDLDKPISTAVGAALAANEAASLAATAVNTAAIAVNTAAISGLGGGATSTGAINAAAIQVNADNIAANTLAIAAGGGGGGGTVDLSPLTAAIVANAADIAANTTAITSNDGAIAANTAAITSNDVDIAANTAAIAGFTGGGGTSTLTVPRTASAITGIVGMLTGTGASALETQSVPPTVTVDSQDSSIMPLYTAYSSAAVTDDVVATCWALPVSGDINIELFRASTGQRVRSSLFPFPGLPGTEPKIAAVNATHILVTYEAPAALGGFAYNVYTWDTTTLVAVSTFGTGSMLIPGTDGSRVVTSFTTGSTTATTDGSFVLAFPLASGTAIECRQRHVSGLTSAVDYTSSSSLPTGLLSPISNLQALTVDADHFVLVMDTGSNILMITVDRSDWSYTYETLAINSDTPFVASVNAGVLEILTTTGAFANRPVTLTTYVYANNIPVLVSSITKPNVVDGASMLPSNTTRIALGRFLAGGGNVRQYLLDFLSGTQAPVSGTSAFTTDTYMLLALSTGDAVRVFMIEDNGAGYDIHSGLTLTSEASSLPTHMLCIVGATTATTADVVPTGGFGTVTLAGQVGDAYMSEGQQVGTYITANTIILTAKFIGDI